MKPELVNRDLLLYKGILSKLSAAKVSWPGCWFLFPFGVDAHRQARGGMLLRKGILSKLSAAKVRVYRTCAKRVAAGVPARFGAKAQCPVACEWP